MMASVIFVCLVDLTETGCSTGFIQSIISHGSTCVCLSVRRAEIPADLLYQQWNAAFIHPTQPGQVLVLSASAFDASASS